MDIQTLCIIVAIILVFNCILWFIFKPKNADPANLEQAIQEKDRLQIEKRQLQVEKNHLEEEKKQLEADLSLSEKKTSQSLDEISSLKL